jgi:GNAT superfamily N-acetyltransferase
VSRYWGRPATEADIARAMREEPSTDLALPSGLLIVATADDEPVGCGGVRLREGGDIAELTRLFVAASARRQGLGAHIVQRLERLAVGHGKTRMRLDTRGDLLEARAMYAVLGYREVEPFNDSAYAEHWFEKIL